MITFVCGCSNSNGVDGILQSKNKVWPSIVMSSYTDNYEFTDNISDIDTNSNLLINVAKAGVGNDYIFHKSLESITKLIRIGKKPNLVIIQWSSPNRRIHQTIDGREVRVSILRKSEYYVKYEPMGSMHSTHYMFALQEFLKSNEIDYLFFNYMQLDESVMELEIFNKLDFTKFVFFGKEKEYILFNGLLEIISENKLNIDDEFHPNDSGHYFIAKGICNKLGISVIDKELFYKKNKLL